MKHTTTHVICLAAALALGCKQKPENTAAPAQSTAPSGSHDSGGPITEAALGVKIYPGARIVTSGETPEIVSANLETADAMDKVVKFYQQELGLPTDGPAEGTLTAKKNNRMYAISVIPSGGTTSISIMGKK